MADLINKIDSFSVTITVDIDQLCRQSMFAAKHHKRFTILLYGLLSLPLLRLIMLHVFYYARNGHLYLRFAVYTLLLLIIYIIGITHEYKLVHKSIIPPTTYFFWKLVYKYYFKNHLDCKYSFKETGYVLSFSGFQSTKRQLYNRIRKLYLTDDMIYDGWALYIERAYMSDEEYNYVIQFLKSKVPEKRIRFRI